MQSNLVLACSTGIFFKEKIFHKITFIFESRALKELSYSYDKTLINLNATEIEGWLL